jgi:hypothetical protein
VGDPGFPLPDPLLEQRIEQFVIPGGQVLNRTGRSFESAEFDSFNELAQAIFGQWEFKTADPSDPLAVETYLFSVQTFEITDITTARPEIYEPANGAVIDFPFQLRWNPLITSYIARGQDLVGSIDRVARGILDVNLVVSPNAINPYFTFELLHNGQSLLPFVSAVTSPMSPDFNLSIGSAAFTRVANITVYPRLVPEPHGLALLATCALSVILTSRKQRSFI